MKTEVRFYDLSGQPHPAQQLEDLITGQLTDAGEGWHVAAAYPVPQPAGSPYTHIVCVIFHQTPPAP